MKTLTFLIAACTLTYSAVAGNPTNDHSDKYCAKTKNGKLTIMHEGKELTSETTLSNGTRVSMDGTVTKADGSTMMLKEGECLDLEGKVMDKSTKDKPNTNTGTGTNTNKGTGTNTNKNSNNSNQNSDWNKSNSDGTGTNKGNNGTMNNGTGTNGTINNNGTKNNGTGTGTNGTNTNGTGTGTGTEIDNK